MHFNKFLSTLLAFSFVIFLPSSVFATNISGPAPHFVAEDIIDIKNEVTGDTFLVGQTIRITKPIKGDIFIIGESISIEAPIEGDVRAIGSSIEVKSIISGSLGFISEKVLIPTTGEVTNDVYGISTKFSLYGRIGKDLNLGYAQGSDILVDGNIGGNIHYFDSLPVLTDNSFLGGEIVKTEIEDYRYSERDQRLQIILGKILHSLSLILIAIIIIKLFPKKFIKGFENYKKSLSRNILLGFLGFIIVPAILLFLLVSVIAIPIALLLSGLLLFAIYIAPLYPATFIGHKLLPNSKSIPVQIVCGIFIYDVVTMGPVIGSILTIFSVSSFLGLILKTLLDLRHKKVQ